MALTGRVLASIYGKNGQSVGTAQGLTESFPAALCYFYPQPANTPTFNGVTTQTVIVLLPTATQVGPTLFYTDSTVTQLATNGS